MFQGSVAARWLQVRGACAGARAPARSTDVAQENVAGFLTAEQALELGERMITAKLSATRLRRRRAFVG